ncbi:hypothetical protein ES703_69754 [subsurface metagenome]
MKDLTLEYIAGFVDGEGSFMIIPNDRESYRPTFIICNTDKKILEDIRQYLSLTTKLRVMKAPNPNSKTGYQLVTRGIDECKSIATLLEPYLRLKKEQAQIIMQFPRANIIHKGWHTLPDFSTRAYILKLRERIMKLNKRGPPTQEANEDLQPEPDPQLNLLDLKQKEVSKP